MGSKETFATNCAAQNTMLNKIYLEKAIWGWVKQIILTRIQPIIEIENQI